MTRPYLIATALIAAGWCLTWALAAYVVSMVPKRRKGW